MFSYVVIIVIIIIVVVVVIIIVIVVVIIVAVVATIKDSLKNKFRLFLATLVALHFTPVSQSVSESVGRVSD